MKVGRERNSKIGKLYYFLAAGTPLQKTNKQTRLLLITYAFIKSKMSKSSLGHQIFYFKNAQKFRRDKLNH